MLTNTRERTYSPQLGQFLRCWVQNPTGIGALMPSGRELSRLVVRDILPGSRVVELGPGTGTVTRAILEAGVEPGDLDIVEKEWQFIPTLRANYGGVRVHQVDAVHVARHLSHLGGTVDFVVSGLPLLLFSRSQRMRILRGAFTLLRDGGALHQFTYGARCPVDRRMLRKLGLNSQRIGVAVKNFPPAFVYRFAKVARS
jgi:phosphatidylethanolamine/phosphatidyl-N-methylethanolamine N-methyltransferase